jgi:hypothetical protein
MGALSKQIWGQNNIVVYVTIDGVWVGYFRFIDHLYKTDSELQVITAPPLISTLRNLPQHPLSLFQPAVSLTLVPWQRLLTMKIPSSTNSRTELHAKSTNSAHNFSA